MHQLTFGPMDGCLGLSFFYFFMKSFPFVIFFSKVLRVGSQPASTVEQSLAITFNRGFETVGAIIRPA